MKTYLVTKEHIQAYLLDYWKRVKEFAEKDGGTLNDLRWVMLGESGRVLLQTLQETLGHTVGDPNLLIMAKYNREAKSVDLWTLKEIEELRKKTSGANNDSTVVSRDYVRETLKNKRAIIFDSSIHSGRSMLALVKEVQKYAPTSVASYSLVLKRNSDFIPNHFGFLIHDWDRALFLLDALPNNRMTFDGVFCRITADTCCNIGFPGWLSTSSQSG